MKKYVLHIVIALVCLCVFSGFRSEQDWMKYKSAEGKYSINFPGKPEESQENSKTNDSIPFLIHYATYSASDNEIYMVGWINMSNFYPNEKSMKQILEDSRDGAVNAMQATNVVTTATKNTGNAYIEFTFEIKELKGKDRIYVINKFQYSVISIYSSSMGNNPKVDKFISSFKYVD